MPWLSGVCSEYKLAEAATRAIKLLTKRNEENQVLRFAQDDKPE
jgi:hypothetical protein